MAQRLRARLSSSINQADAAGDVLSGSGESGWRRRWAWAGMRGPEYLGGLHRTVHVKNEGGKTVDLCTTSTDFFVEAVFR